MLRAGGAPIPYLAAALRLTTQPYARWRSAAPMTPMISTSPGDMTVRICLKRFSGSFVEQMGSGFRFTNGTDSLTVSSEIYWRYFVVWQVPTHTLQGP